MSKVHNIYEIQGFSLFRHLVYAFLSVLLSGWNNVPTDAIEKGRREFFAEMSVRKPIFKQRLVARARQTNLDDFAQRPERHP